MQEDDDGSSAVFKVGLEDVHPDSIDVLNEARSDSARQYLGAVGLLGARGVRLVGRTDHVNQWVIE